MKQRTYTFNCEKACRSHTENSEVGRRELWHLTIPASDLPLELKLGPNARHATEKKATVGAMLATLENEPAQFLYYNGGIMIVAEKVSAESNRITLVCNEAESDDEDEALGHGILNGGHTFLALKKALTEAKEHEGKGKSRFAHVADTVMVTLTIATGIAEDEIWHISRARNTSEKVPMYALRNLAGDWSLLKPEIPEVTRPLVSLKPGENENALFDTVDLLKRLVLLDNKTYPAQKSQHPMKAYTSSGALVKGYDPDTFKRTAPLLKDALWLEEQVYRFYESKPSGITVLKSNGAKAVTTQLLSGYIAKLWVADPLIFPAIAAFRVFVDDAGNWAKPLTELWDEFGSNVVERLYERYRSEGKANVAYFGRSKSAWESAVYPTSMAASALQLFS